MTDTPLYYAALQAGCTRRQAELLVAYTDSSSMKEAATVLGVSYSTAKAHMAGAVRRLHAPHPPGLVMKLLTGDFEIDVRRPVQARPAVPKVRDVPVLDCRHVNSWVIPEWINARGHYVYVAWSKSDPEEALYVGVSSHLFLRFAQHAAGSLWWADADHLDVHEHPDHTHALVCEARTIARLDPEYNISRPMVVVA